jgi:5'-3' exonuclease
MGIRGLKTYLRQYFTPAAIDGPPKRIGVDAMAVLYRFRDGAADFTRTLKEKGHTLFFIFDGRTPVEKEAEVAERIETRAKPARRLESLQEFVNSGEFTTCDGAARKILLREIEDLKAQSWHITRDIRRAFQRDLWRLDIPYVKALEEADGVLVDMFRHGKIDCILSTDMDYLFSGVEVVWMPTPWGALEEIQLSPVLADNKLTFGAFQEACILCGTDETKRLCHMEPARAFSYIRYYGSIKNMIRLKKDFIPVEFTEEYLAGVLERANLVSAGPWDRARADHVARVSERFQASL